MFKVIKDPLAESAELSNSPYMLTLDGLKKWFAKNLDIKLAFLFTSDKAEAIRQLHSTRGDNQLPYNDRFALAVVSELSRNDEDNNNFANRRFGSGNHCTSEEDNVTVWTTHAFKINLNVEITVYVRDILDYIDLQTKLYILLCHRASLNFKVVPPAPAVSFNVSNVEPLSSIPLTPKDAGGGAQSDFYELTSSIRLATAISATRNRAKFNNEGEVKQTLSIRGQHEDFNR